MPLPDRPVSIRLAFAALAAAALAGCAQPRTSTAEPSLEALVGAPAAASWTALLPQAALLHLPDGRDRPVTLRERRQARTVVQEIELPARGGSGRNLLTIAVHGEAAQPGLYPGKPSEAGIKAEIAAAFPGRTLRIVPQPRRNAYGPYGLAVSAGADGQRCVYAWQWLDRDDKRAAEALGEATSWRARICRRRESLDEIAAALDQITLGARPDLVAEPEPVRPAPAKVVRKRPAQPAVARPRAPERQPVAALPAFTPGGQRYLAEVPAGLRLPAGANGVQPVLDQSLPAEAYRGPAQHAGQTPRPVLREAQASRGAVPTPD